MKKILLPVDGSETCGKSFEKAKEMGLNFNSEVIILTVKAPYEQFYHNSNPAHKVHHEEHSQALAEKTIESAVAKFDGTDVNISTTILEGHVASTIIEYAEKEKVDLIVMCTHGMSGFKKFALGSNTQKVVMHATVPVLVVR